LESAEHGDFVAIGQWLDQYKANRHTHRAYERELYRLVIWRQEQGISSLRVLTQDDILAFRSWLAVKREPDESPLVRGALSASSIRRAMAAIRLYFAWLVDRGEISRNPVGKEKLVRSKVVLASNVPSKKIRASMQARARAERGTEEGAREHFVVQFFFWAGARREEMAESSMADISVAKGVSQWTPPGRRRTPVVLPKPVLDALRAYRRARDLPAAISKDEKDEPLVCSLIDGSWVTGWTLNRIAKVGLRHLSETGATAFQRPIALSSRSLRRALREELATELPAKLALRHLRRTSLTTANGDEGPNGHRALLNRLEQLASVSARD